MESYQMLRTTNLFQVFRKEGYPTRHPDNRIDGFFDLELFAIIFAVVSIGFSLLFILPGFRGKEVCLNFLINLLNFKFCYNIANILWNSLFGLCIDWILHIR